jgi:hypothetical protein
MHFQIRKNCGNKRDISSLLLDILKGKAEYDLVLSISSLFLLFDIFVYLISRFRW